MYNTTGGVTTSGSRRAERTAAAAPWPPMRHCLKPTQTTNDAAHNGANGSRRSGLGASAGNVNATKSKKLLPAVQMPGRCMFAKSISPIG